MVASDMGLEGAAFAASLADWRRDLPAEPLEAFVRDAGGPEHVGIFCVDLTNGFCHEGALQSDRVAAIIPPIVDLMARAHHLGVPHFVLPQDCHPADSVEFQSYPPHCVCGTAEAQTVPEVLAQPFAGLLTVLEKRSISSSIGTGLDAWLREHPDVTHRIVVGDCTDLCVYQLAMHLKLAANAANEASPVVVPADCVDTYDMPASVARELGAPAHPGGFFHTVFLYHMALNGVRVVASLT